MLKLIIPARNEAAYIQDTLYRLSKSLQDIKGEWVIIVVDNGSAEGDRTLQKINEFIARSNQYAAHSTRSNDEVINNTKYEVISTKYKYLSCPTAGKGAAIRYAAEQMGEDSNKYQAASNKSEVLSQESIAKYRILNTKYTNASRKVDGFQSESISDISPWTSDDIFGFIDADLSADPDAISGMLEKIQNNEADIVIASRLLQTKTTNRSFLRTLSSHIFNFLIRLTLGLSVKDAQCGLKLMNQRATDILLTCTEDGWFLDIEFLAKARQYKLRVQEVPVPWTEFRYPDRKSHIRHVRDGLGALRAIWRIRRGISPFIRLRSK